MTKTKITLILTERDQSSSTKKQMQEMLMSHNKNCYSGQLVLPFNQKKLVENSSPSLNNIIDFEAKSEARREQKLREIKEKGIKKLLDYAESLEW